MVKKKPTKTNPALNDLFIFQRFLFIIYTLLDTG